MKLLLPLIAVVAVTGLTMVASADPSESGLEHRNSDFNPTRTGWDKPVSVPETGGTLGLLSLGVASLAFWRLRLVS